MKTSDILRILQEKQDVNSSDTEQIMTYSPITQKKFPVPRHFAKEVPTGTLKDIVRKSGVEF